MLPTSGLISQLVAESRQLKELVETPVQATAMISASCRNFKLFESRFTQDYDLFNFFSTNDCFNSATSTSMAKCGSRLDQVKTYLDSQGIKDLGIIRHNSYVENSDIVSQTKGLLYKTVSDILFIQRDSYLDFVREISKAFDMFHSFNQKTAQNCVDTMRAKEISELFNSGLDMEYQKNIALDLTSRFNAYKTILKQPCVIRTLNSVKHEGEMNPQNPLKALLLKVQEDKFFCLISKYRSIVRHLLSKLHVFLHVFDDIKEVQLVNDLETRSVTTPASQQGANPLSEADQTSNCHSPPSEKAAIESGNGLASSESTLYLTQKKTHKVNSAIGIGPPKSTFAVALERHHGSTHNTVENDSSKNEDAVCLTPPKKLFTNASTSARFNLEKDSNSKKHEQRFRTDLQDARPDEQSKGFQMNLGSPRPFCPSTSKKTILKNIEEVLEIKIEDRYSLKSSIGSFEYKPGEFNRILALETVDEVSSHTGIRDSVKSRSSALRSDDNLREFEMFNRTKKLSSSLKKPVGKDYCNPCTLI